MKNTLTNWLLAVGIFGLFAGAPQLDGPSDHATEQAQAEDLQAAIETEAQEARYARASAAIAAERVQP